MKALESRQVILNLLGDISDIKYVASKMARDHRYLVNEWFKVVYGFMHHLAIQYERGDAYPDYVLHYQFAAQWLQHDEIIYRSEYSDKDFLERVEKASQVIMDVIPGSDIDSDEVVARKLSDMINGRISDPYVVGGLLADASHTQFGMVYNLFYAYIKFLSLLRSKCWYDPRDEWATKVAEHWMPSNSHWRNEEIDAELSSYLNAY